MHQEVSASPSSAPSQTTFALFGYEVQCQLQVASQEAYGHPEANRRIEAAESGQTVRSIVFDLSRRIRWPADYTGRLLCNRHAETWLGREGELEARTDEVGCGYALTRERSDFDMAGVIAGEAAGLIHDIPPAAEIVERIAAEAEYGDEGTSFGPFQLHIGGLGSIAACSMAAW